jgi:hypothetical protein
MTSISLINDLNELSFTNIPKAEIKSVEPRKQMNPIDTSFDLFLNTQMEFHIDLDAKNIQVENNGQNIEVDGDNMFFLPKTAYTHPITLTVYQHHETLVGTEENHTEETDGKCFRTVTTKYRKDILPYPFTFDLAGCKYDTEYDAGLITYHDQGRSTVSSDISHTCVVSVTYKILYEGDHYDEEGPKPHNYLIVSFSSGNG